MHVIGVSLRFFVTLASLLEESLELAIVPFAARTSRVDAFWM